MVRLEQYKKNDFEVKTEYLSYIKIKASEEFIGRHLLLTILLGSYST